MAEHLGYGPHEWAGRGSGNSGNGGYDKTVTTEIGEVDLRVPRDRLGTFEPVVVPKYQRRLDGLSGNVISLYAKGLTTGDIQQHLVEIYGTEVSCETISKITDQVVDEMVAWQSRPLDPLYAVLLIDCLVIKVRGSQVANRPVYVAIGVNLQNRGQVFLVPSWPPGRQRSARMIGWNVEDLTPVLSRALPSRWLLCSPAAVAALLFPRGHRSSVASDRTGSRFRSLVSFRESPHLSRPMRCSMFGREMFRRKRWT